MLKIGEFSRIAQVTTKTLRLYDERGLLKPTWIDRFNGYRYYNLEQLAQLNRILALKDLGFSLEQISQVMQEDLPSAELRGMMRLKKVELQQRITADQARLARIGARLDHLDHAGLPSEIEVVVKTIPPTWVMGVRQEITGYDQLGQIFAQVQRDLDDWGYSESICGPWIGIYHDSEYQNAGLDVEVAAPLANKALVTRSGSVYELPGLDSAACLVHQGPYANIADAHERLLTWLEDNRYQMAGAIRDVYLQRPSKRGGTVDTMTEIQFAIKPKPKLSAIPFDKEQKEMEPKIVTKPAFTVVGLLYHGRNQNNEIPQLWGKLNPRYPEIKETMKPTVAYGMCGPMETDGSFPYLAGFAVKEAKDLPEGMTSWDVSEETYVVFPCTLNNIHETYEYAFKTWLPQSAYIHINKPDFECYDQDFDDGQKLTIYIPVQPK